MKVKGAKGPNAFSLPSAGFQKVDKVEGKDTELRVFIDLEKPLIATQEEREDPEYMAPSAMVDSSDEVIIALAAPVFADLPWYGRALVLVSVYIIILLLLRVKRFCFCFIKVIGFFIFHYCVKLV